MDSYLSKPSLFCAVLRGSAGAGCVSVSRHSLLRLRLCRGERYAVPLAGGAKSFSGREEPGPRVVRRCAGVP